MKRLSVLGLAHPAHYRPLGNSQTVSTAGSRVKDYVAGLEGRIHLERLPAYAPELNPVEYVWAHLKQHELPNVCAKDLWSLGEMARERLRRMRRRKPLLAACWKQSSLAF
ncbi:MAG: transposase [Bryobacterales bacterium]|nr:transposase [Bryobacterales bacterium]